MSVLREEALKSKAWPFEEARRVLKRYAKGAPEKGYVLFETGYGPSGLPHIGTFGEVARTTMIKTAFEVISDIPTKLICFSDDLDGMRKIPGNEHFRGARRRSNTRGGQTRSLTSRRRVPRSAGATGRGPALAPRTGATGRPPSPPAAAGAARP